jgi:hypothetical protein
MAYNATKKYARVHESHTTSRFAAAIIVNAAHTPMLTRAIDTEGPHESDDRSSLVRLLERMSTDDKGDSHYGADFKAKVALEAIKGELTMSQLCAKHGVHQTTVNPGRDKLSITFPLCLNRKRTSERTAMPRSRNCMPRSASWSWNPIF